jgi:hypothetical protein
MKLTGHFTLEEFVRNSVILERGRNPQSDTDDCIHIQFRVYYPRRTAFVGQTHNRGVYRPVEVAA